MFVVVSQNLKVIFAHSNVLCMYYNRLGQWRDGKKKITINNSLLVGRKPMVENDGCQKYEQQRGM